MQQLMNLNMNIEKEVQQNLRQLKQTDNQIEDIINREAEHCSLQEQIEESIRKILTNKQPNYLSKAEPYLTRKTQCTQNLNKLREQKVTIKQEKIVLIKRLLEKLEKLKDHRQKRVIYCGDKKLTGQAISMLTLLISDLNEILSHRKNNQQNDATIKKLTKSLDLSNERIQKTSQQLLALFSQQQNLLQEINKIYCQNYQSKYLETKLLQKASLQPTDLMGFMDRSSAFIRQQQDKKKELEQILQAVSTTNQTIKIFRHIHEVMQSQNKRRGDLLKKLKFMQEQQQNHVAIEDRIGQIQGQLQKIQGKKQRLLKKLSSKVNQADLTAYKTINQQLQTLETEIRVKAIIIKDMRNELNQKLRKFLVESSSINQQYGDITSQVIPQFWAKQLDFKEETINEIKGYLSKMYNRLKR